MPENYDALFTPMQIGKTTIKNRIVLVAMEGTGIVEGQFGFKFNEHCREYYLDRAKNNVGLMIPGMLPVRSFAGNKFLGDAEKVMLGPVKELLDEIHSYDSKVFFQLGAGMGRVMVAIPILRKLYYNKFLGWTVKKLVGMDVHRMFRSPDAGLPNVWDTNIKSTAMTIAEIQETIREFGRAAELCKRAGVDGIEIHAVHEGYLLDQFTVSSTNHRSDAYGGCLENRFRFTCEIIKEIKKTCGADYPVSVRFSVESKMIGFNDGALPGEDYVEFGRDMSEGIAGAKILETAGADMLDADNGSYDSWYWAHPPMYMPLSCNLESVAAIKPHVNIPVVCAGRMENPDTASAALRSGKVDAIGIARQFLCDPAYATKVKENRVDDIRPCIACHNGCFGVSKYKGNPGDLPKIPMGHCALNPVTLAEEKYKITPAVQKKNIAIIGGGIGGMEVARLCTLRGHNVTIYEKSDELGGVFISATTPEFKEKDKMLLNWYIKQMKDLNVPIKFNTEVKPEQLASLGADEVVIATGAQPRLMPVPGAEKANVMEAIEYLRGKKETGHKVVVVGGGITGCEIAYDLIRKGKEPVIVEMLDDIMKIHGLSAANSNFLRDAFRHNNTPIHLEARVLEINDSEIIIETPAGQQTIAADSVITSIGYTSTPLVEKTGEHTHIVGDAAKVGNLLTVIWGAYDLGVAI